MAEKEVELPDDDIEIVEESDEPQTDEFGMTEEEVITQAKFLQGAILDAEDNASARYAKYEKWRRQAEAQPMAKLRSLNPLRNPSNIMPPLTQIHQQTMGSNLISYFGMDPFWTWKALKDDDDCRKQATFLTKYFKILASSPSDLNLEPAKRTICNETALLDRCVVKVPFTVEQWTYKGTDPKTGAKTDQMMIYHEGPEIIPIPAEDFVYPAQWDDIRYMPWIAHIVHIPEHELLAKAEQQIYDADKVQELLDHGRQSPTVKESAELARGGDQTNNFTAVYDLAEVYFYYDADGDGLFEDYVWTIDMVTGIVLRKGYNELGIRPFEAFRYIERPHSFGGRAVGQICEGLQDECEGIHNTRNDNMKIANTRMFTMSRTTKQANNEEIFPGKIWVNDSETEIKSLQLGEVYPSSLQAEDKTWQLAAQATGQSEVQRGFGDPTLGQRDTYRGQQMRMAASKGIFGTIADGMKESFSRVGFLVILQLINHREEVLDRERRIQRLTEDEIAQLDKVLSITPSDVPNKFAYTVQSVDPSQTPGAKLEAIGQFLNIYSNWGMQSTQLATQLFTPQGVQMQQQAPELYNHLVTIYAGQAKLVKKLLILVGIEDAPDSMLPNTELMDHLIGLNNDAKHEAMKQMEAQNGAKSTGSYDSTLSPEEQNAGDGAGFGGGSDQGFGSQGGSGGGQAGFAGPQS